MSRAPTSSLSFGAILINPIISMIATLESMALGLLFVLCAFVITPVYKLVYNATESAPVGWYLFKTRHVLRVGELVLAKLPERSADLANERGYCLARSPS